MLEEGDNDLEGDIYQHLKEKLQANGSQGHAAILRQRPYSLGKVKRS